METTARTTALILALLTAVLGVLAQILALARERQGIARAQKMTPPTRDTYRVGMTHATVNVNRQGRLVIPAEMRRELGIEPGASLVAYVERGRLVVEDRKHLIKRLQDEVAQHTAPGTPSMVDHLIAERRMEARAESAWLTWGEEGEHAVRKAWNAEADAAKAAGRAVEWYARQAQ